MLVIDYNVSFFNEVPLQNKMLCFILWHVISSLYLSLRWTLQSYELHEFKALIRINAFVYAMSSYVTRNWVKVFNLGKNRVNKGEEGGIILRTQPNVSLCVWWKQVSSRVNNVIRHLNTTNNCGEQKKNLETIKACFLKHGTESNKSVNINIKSFYL